MHFIFCKSTISLRPTANQNIAEHTTTFILAKIGSIFGAWNWYLKILFPPPVIQQVPRAANKVALLSKSFLEDSRVSEVCSALSNLFHNVNDNSLSKLIFMGILSFW